MGLQKVAFNFMAERGGKLAQSLLCSKPVKSPDISKLGVCLSNGNIHFQTEQSAVNYIRHRLLESLNRPVEQQFERAVTKRGTRILSETNGTKMNAPLPFTHQEIMKRTDKNAIRDVELWHSHPDLYGVGKTSPLSPPDFGDLNTFNSLHLKKIVAINSKGEINSMEAVQGYSPKKFKKFQQKFENYMAEKLLKLLPKNEKKRLAEIECYLKKNNFTKLPAELDKELQEIEQQIIEAQSSGEGAKLMHEFYKTAEKYGMKYYNSFSNLP